MQTWPGHRRGEGYCIDMLEGGWRANKDGRCGLPCVGNGNGGRLDAKHGGAGEGSTMDLGEGELVKEIGWTS